MEGFHLVDVEERARQSPTSFHISAREDRSALAAGDLAKVILELDQQRDNGPSAERLWVEIRRVQGGRYLGKLDNTPVVVSAELGDEITFGPEHVADYDLRCQLVLPVRSRSVLGYHHPVGRHASIVRRLNGQQIVIKVHTFDYGDRGIVVDADTHLWVEQLTVDNETWTRPVQGPDPLDPRQFFRRRG